MKNSSVVTWTFRRGEGSFPSVVNVEKLVVENLFVLTAPVSTEEIVSVPLRASFSHSSLIALSPFWEIGFGLTVAAGMESRLSTTGTLLLPSIGFELRANARLRL